MENITEIKDKLDSLYEEYKKNKSQLNKEKTKEVAKLLFELTFNENDVMSDVATQLSRFSADVVKIYFETITKDKSIPVDLLDEVIKEFLATDKDANKSQYFVQKFVFTITSIMKNYKDKALSSVQIPRLVGFIARFAVKSEKNRNKFQALINNTMGGIFMLDYSNIKKNSLTNIWNATKAVYPDLSKAKYESFITEWGKKYSFIQDDASEVSGTSEKTVKIEENIVLKDMTVESIIATDVKTASTDNSVVSATCGSEASSKGEATEKVEGGASILSNESSKLTDEKSVLEYDEKKKTASASSATSEKESSSEVNMKSLYAILKRDIIKEQEAIITAFTDLIAPIGKTCETIQGEVKKSREIGAENVALKAKAEDLERQLSEQRSRLQEVNQSLKSSRIENEELKKQISSLESKNSELDSKLNDAYSINSRESSMEAEKIRSELKKAFAYLYEDWLEYEFSDVSEDNFESLQAIIKKIFRSLERNGIDFKGNN